MLYDGRRPGSAKGLYSAGQRAPTGPTLRSFHRGIWIERQSGMFRYQEPLHLEPTR